MIKPRISVIIGIYNCASTLVEALDSLYAQTYQEFKIILCDDGSTDNTYQIAEEYSSKHENIVLVKNDKNMGLNYTLNHCLEYADTEFIARMDGDDISLPERFEKEIDFLDSHQEYAIVSCPMIYFDENGEFGRGRGGQEPTKTAFIYGTPFCHAPCMVRTEAIKDVGGYSYGARYRRGQDYNLWMKMYAKGYRGYTLEEHLYKMRDDRNAISRRKFSSAINDMRSRWLACKTLHLPLKGYFLATRPVFVSLLPNTIYRKLHKMRLKNK